MKAPYRRRTFIDAASTEALSLPHIFAILFSLVHVNVQDKYICVDDEGSIKRSKLSYLRE